MICFQESNDRRIVWMIWSLKFPNLSPVLNVIKSARGVKSKASALRTVLTGNHLRKVWRRNERRIQE
jgi:hypothetical protein